MSFCVNNSSDPRVVKAAIQALRRTVKHGKRAEKVLKELETNGYYDGKVLAFAKFSKKFLATTYAFPVRKCILREDIPGWKELSLDFGECRFGSHGGMRFKTMPVYLLGKSLNLGLNSDFNPTGKIFARPQSSKIPSALLGECRMKSNGHVTFAPGSSTMNRGKVTRIRKSPRRDEATVFAKIVTEKLVNFNGVHPNLVPQPMLDLKKEVPLWLIEDGHIDRMMASMMDMIEVVKVMDA